MYKLLITIYVGLAMQGMLYCMSPNLLEQLDRAVRQEEVKISPKGNAILPKLSWDDPDKDYIIEFDDQDECNIAWWRKVFLYLVPGYYCTPRITFKNTKTVPTLRGPDLWNRFFVSSVEGYARYKNLIRRGNRIKTLATGLVVWPWLYTKIDNHDLLLTWQPAYLRPYLLFSAGIGLTAVLFYCLHQFIARLRLNELNNSFIQQLALVMPENKIQHFKDLYQDPSTKNSTLLAIITEIEQAKSNLPS